MTQKPEHISILEQAKTALEGCVTFLHALGYHGGGNTPPSNAEQAIDRISFYQRNFTERQLTQEEVLALLSHATEVEVNFLSCFQDFYLGWGESGGFFSATRCSTVKPTHRKSIPNSTKRTQTGQSSFQPTEMTSSTTSSQEPNSFQAKKTNQEAYG